MKFTRSYWIDSTEETKYPSLKEDLIIDIAIVGGGIVGITSALLLQKEGFKVAILEGNKIIKGASGHTTAKITSQHNLIYDYLIKTFGFEKAQQYGEANEKALEFMVDKIEKNNINCNLEVLPSYVYTLQDNYVSKIERELEACHELGLNAHYKGTFLLSLPIKASIEFINQAQFHPRKYLLSLAKEFVSLGGLIYEDTRVIDLEEGSPIILTTEDKIKIKATQVISASHFPCYDGSAKYFTRLRPERSYLIGVTAKDDFPRGMFISAEDPKRSLRRQNDQENQLILIGGESHKTGEGKETEFHFNALNNFAKDLFTIDKELYRWSTQDYITIDRVPYIGRLSSSSENIYVATGFGKWGMSGGTNAAIMLRDLIVKGSSPYEELFCPSRHITPSSVKNFIIENLDTAKELVKGKLKINSRDLKLDSDEGKTVSIDGEKYGAYKDTEGTLHLVDITCTHLGCELTWNCAERTWDCPCHGSRFNFKGEIIEGPALEPLKYFKGKPY